MVEEPEEIQEMRRELRDITHIYHLLCWMEDPTRVFSPRVGSLLVQAQTMMKKAAEQQKAELDTASDKFWDSVYERQKQDDNTDDR